MNLQYKTLSFKASTAQDSTDSGLNPNEFDGYASTFLGPVDCYGEIMAPTAFDKTLDFFLENGVILREHNIPSALGRPLECRTDKTGLYLKGMISDTSDGRDALTLLRDKVIKKLSIGFTTEGYEVLSEERGVELLGQAVYDKAIKAMPWYVDGLTLITQVKLYEVSLVAFPANTAADITGVKSLRSLAGKIETRAEYERALRDILSFSREEAAALATRGFDALGRSDTPATGDGRDNMDAVTAATCEALKSLSAAFAAK